MQLFPNLLTGVLLVLILPWGGSPAFAETPPPSLAAEPVGTCTSPTSFAAPPEARVSSGGLTTQAECTATADCTDGPEVDCKGTSTCLAQDATCDPNVQGWVECDGERTWCSTLSCPCVPGSFCTSTDPNYCGFDGTCYLPLKKCVCDGQCTEGIPCDPNDPNDCGFDGTCSMSTNTCMCT